MAGADAEKDKEQVVRAIALMAGADTKKDNERVVVIAIAIASMAEENDQIAKRQGGKWQWR